MVMPGETILNGAPNQCPDCKMVPKLEVYNANGDGKSFALYTFCLCGPYSRETHYMSRDEANRALEDWKNDIPTGAR